jgi:hypothetical protein
MPNKYFYFITRRKPTGSGDISLLPLKALAGVMALFALTLAAMGAWSLLQ